MTHRIIPLLPMLALLIWAAAEDVRTRRIRNWLTISLAAGGLLASLVMPTALVTPGQAGLGLLIGFVFPFILFALGALGAGDVKLLAGIGAWVGPVAIVQIFLAEAIVGLLIVLVQCAWQGRLTALFKNSAVLAINLAHINHLGVRHMSETGRSCRSIDRPLPYAVPVLVATLIVITMF